MEIRSMGRSPEARRLFCVMMGMPLLSMVKSLRNLSSRSLSMGKITTCISTSEGVVEDVSSER